MRRSRVNSRKDKRNFSRTAERVHPRNHSMPLRGGIRL
ncbi:MAG: hypothetical protein [Microvirus sp.]|nr:MAG: hypothetical protein [Microvirus sp.]